MVPCVQKLGEEVCNGGDDDCNGIIDDGCTDSVVFRPDPAGDALGNITIANGFTQGCPDGSVLVGLQVKMGTRLDQVTSVCRQIELHLDGSQSVSSYAFTSAPPVLKSASPYNPSEHPATVELTCPEGQLVCGLDGTTGPTSRHYTQRIAISCAPLALGNGFLDFDRSKVQMLTPVTCTGCTVSPDFNYHATVEAGHVAFGLFGAVGDWVDLVGIATETARVTNR